MERAIKVKIDAMRRVLWLSDNILGTPLAQSFRYSVFRNDMLCLECPENSQIIL